MSVEAGQQHFVPEQSSYVMNSESEMLAREDRIFRDAHDGARSEIAKGTSWEDLYPTELEDMISKFNNMTDSEAALTLTATALVTARRQIEAAADPNTPPTTASPRAIEHHVDSQTSIFDSLELSAHEATAYLNAEKEAKTLLERIDPTISALFDEQLSTN